MDLSLLTEPLLVLIMAMAALVSMVGCLQAATRPAAVRTGLVATALTMGQLIFVATRFGNMFYLPLLGNFVDRAANGGEVAQATLLAQLQWVVVGSALGALAAFLLLPTFVEVCVLAVYSIRHRRMQGALWGLTSPRPWRSIAGTLRAPGMMGTQLFALQGIPKTFLLANVAATAIWTVGAVAALAASGLEEGPQQTAILLSGLVNCLAAIAFSVWVDPQAALLTDQTKPGRLNTATVHLMLGNIVGCLLGLILLKPAIRLITLATTTIETSFTDVETTIAFLVVASALILLLNGTVYSSRISAVQTGQIATSIAVFNLFSLAARLSGQVYAPFVGAVTEKLSQQPEPLLLFYRKLLAGASLGCLLGLLLIPTFVQLFNVLISGLARHQSWPKVFLQGLHPYRWSRLMRCFRFPWKQHLSRQALARLPKSLLWANVVVLGFQTVGQLAAVYAGAVLSPALAGTTTLLSPLINGVATIVLAVLVDPGCADLVDEAVAGKRDPKDIETLTFWLALGAVLGTVLSQLFFLHAAGLISQGALFLNDALADLR